MEAWEHNEWLIMQEMGSDYYKLHKRHEYDSEGEDDYEAKRRMEWEEEEEKAKTEYFNKIAEEEKKNTTEKLWRS